MSFSKQENVKIKLISSLLLFYVLNISVLIKCEVEYIYFMTLLSKKDASRERRIIKNLKLDKLPFKIRPENFCDFSINVVKDHRAIFSLKGRLDCTSWCLSSMKKFKIFLLIFEANELGVEIYKEQIASKLPDYSYKTVASIIDEGLKKKYFIKLPPRLSKIKDLKIRNIRPSEELTADFINWNIDAISILNSSVNNYYRQ